MKSQTKMGKKLDKILKNKLKNIKKAKPILTFPNGTIMDCIFVNGICTKGKWKNEKKWTLFK